MEFAPRSTWERRAVAGGLLAYERLPIAHAERLVTQATLERHHRRGYDDQPEISLAEVDLVVGLIYIGAISFTLQHPIGRYDADIYFPTERICVEVDGRDWHDWKTDRRRDAYMLSQHGIVTVRYPATAVWHDCVAVAQSIAAHIGLRRRELRKAA